MALEVSKENIVVRGEVADAVVFFCGCINDGGRVMGEACEVGTVFLTEERFDRSAFFGVIQQERVGRGGGKKEFTRVVEIEGCYVGVLVA